MRPLILIVGMVAGLGTGAAAQSANEPVPRELVVALLGWIRGTVDYSSLLIGRAPPDMDPAMIPPNAEVLGSVSYEESHTIVLAFKENPNQAREAFENHLKTQGWTSRSYGQDVNKGFINQNSVGPMGPLCKGNTFAMLRASVRQSGGSIVGVMFMSSPGGPCSQPETAPRTTWLGDYPIPALYPPPGLTGQGGGSGGSDDARQLQTRLRGRAPAQEVLRHYAAQLAGGGWTAGPATSAEGVAIQTFTYPPKDGKSFHATLSVAIPEGNASIDVGLHVRRMTK